MVSLLWTLIKSPKYIPRLWGARKEVANLWRLLFLMEREKRATLSAQKSWDLMRKTQSDMEAYLAQLPPHESKGTYDPHFTKRSADNGPCCGEDK